MWKFRKPNLQDLELQNRCRRSESQGQGAANDTQVHIGCFQIQRRGAVNVPWGLFPRTEANYVIHWFWLSFIQMADRLQTSSCRGFTTCFAVQLGPLFFNCEVIDWVFFPSSFQIEEPPIFTFIVDSRMVM